MSGLDPFYPIVDSAAWVARLVGTGARLIQLRVKDRDEGEVARETREALAICRVAGAFRQAVEAGHAAFLAGAIEPRELAQPSTPVIGTAFRA